jgi:hypothetical protein
MKKKKKMNELNGFFLRQKEGFDSYRCDNWFCNYKKK